MGLHRLPPDEQGEPLVHRLAARTASEGLATREPSAPPGSSAHPDRWDRRVTEGGDNLSPPSAASARREHRRVVTGAPSAGSLIRPLCCPLRAVWGDWQREIEWLGTRRSRSGAVEAAWRQRRTGVCINILIDALPLQLISMRAPITASRAGGSDAALRRFSETHVSQVASTGQHLIGHGADSTTARRRRTEAVQRAARELKILATGGALRRSTSVVFL